MENPWVAVIAVGGTDNEVVADAVNALREQKVPVEDVAPQDWPDLLSKRAPALTLIHAPELTIDVLEMLRLLKGDNVPVVVIVDELTEEQELILLHSGAWEVIGLPTSARRLRARVSTLYQYVTSRPTEGHEEVHHLDNVMINLKRHEVTVDGTPVPLTKTEFDLLLALARDPHAVLSRDELLHDAGERGSIGPRSLESHLSRLRLKIRSAGGPRLVESVRGVGYRLRS